MRLVEVVVLFGQDLPAESQAGADVSTIHGEEDEQQEAGPTLVKIFLFRLAAALLVVVSVLLESYNPAKVYNL